LNSASERNAHSAILFEIALNYSQKRFHAIEKGSRKMKRKLIILMTVLLIIASLVGCKDPYEGAMVGAWQDENRLVGVLFREDGTCDVTFAREFITETVECAYGYSDGRVVIYNPRLYSIEDFDLEDIPHVSADKGVTFSINRDKKDGVVDGFWLASLIMQKSDSVNVQSFSEWLAGLSAGGVTLNDAAAAFTGNKFAGDAIEWIEEALVEKQPIQ
jgi:hypothetical protein